MFYANINTNFFFEWKNKLALLSQLRMRQLAKEHHRRVTTQVLKPYASMDYAQYGGTPYLRNHSFGWSQHPNTSWNTSYTTLQTPQVQRSSLEEIMAKLERGHAEMDYSQVGLHRFLDQNKKSQPPHERMTNLEANMVELERLHAKFSNPQVQFMNETRTTL